MTDKRTPSLALVVSTVELRWIDRYVSEHSDMGRSAFMRRLLVSALKTAYPDDAENIQKVFTIGPPWSRRKAANEMKAREKTLTPESISHQQMRDEKARTFIAILGESK